MSHASRGRLTAKSLRTLLADGFEPGTAILLYDQPSSRTSLAIWLIDSSGVRATASVPIPPSAVQKAIDDARASLGLEPGMAARAPRPRANRGLVRSEDSSPSKAGLDELSELLLPPPIASALSEVGDILVVPTNAIGTVPFPALRAGGRHLLDAHSVTVLASLLDLGPVHGMAAPPPTRNPLIVGDPVLRNDREWDFPPLPGARREAGMAGQLLSAPVLIGEAATLEQVRKAAPLADLLYLATHGVASGVEPLEGFLALSGDGGRTRRWTADEIQRTTLRARLAVLSACQTGLGAAHAGGVIGVARAFFLAGVPDVAMSLWNVDDAATTWQMEQFLKLSVQHRAVEALRRSSLAARDRYPDVARWAAFSMFGGGMLREGAGLRPHGARLQIQPVHGGISVAAAAVPADLSFRLEVVGGDTSTRSHAYLVVVDAAGVAVLVDHRTGKTYQFEGTLGPATLLLIEANRPMIPGLLDYDGDPPRTMAGLMALFPQDDPTLDLRMLRLQVNVTPSIQPQADPER